MKKLIFALVCFVAGSVTGIAQDDQTSRYQALMTAKDKAHMAHLANDLPRKFALFTPVLVTHLTPKMMIDGAELVAGPDPITGADPNGLHFDPPPPPCSPCVYNSGWYQIADIYSDEEICDYADGEICEAIVEEIIYEDDYGTSDGVDGTLYYEVFNIIEYLYCIPADFFCPDCDD